MAKNNNPLNTMSKTEIRTALERKFSQHSYAGKTAMLYFCLVLTGILLGAIIFLLTLPVSKSTLYIIQGCIMVPLFAAFFDCALIRFPTGNISYEALAAGLKHNGYDRMFKKILNRLFIDIILITLLYFLAVGFLSQSIICFFCFIGLSWFITGIIQFVRNC